MTKAQRSLALTSARALAMASVHCSSEVTLILVMKTLSWIKLQERAMLMAVSCLSPVIIQNLIPAAMK